MFTHSCDEKAIVDTRQQESQQAVAALPAHIEELVLEVAAHGLAVLPVVVEDLNLAAEDDVAAGGRAGRGRLRRAHIKIAKLLVVGIAAARRLPATRLANVVEGEALVDFGTVGAATVRTAAFFRHK